MYPSVILAAEAEVEAAAIGAALNALNTLAEGSSAGWQIAAIVLGVIGAPLATLAGYYVTKLLKKIGIETDEAMHQMVRNQADRVIDQVEAWANKKAQEGSKEGRASKLAKGIELLESVLKATGAKEKLSLKLEHIIEERLVARGIVKTGGSSSDPS